MTKKKILTICVGFIAIMFLWELGCRYSQSRGNCSTFCGTKILMGHYSTSFGELYYDGDECVAPFRCIGDPFCFASLVYR